MQIALNDRSLLGLTIVLIMLAGCGVREIVQEATPLQAASPVPPVPSSTPTPIAAPTSSEPTIETAAEVDQLIADLFSDTLVPLQTYGEQSPSRYGDVAVVRLNGTGYEQLTTDRYNRDPVLSPDRQRIAYRSVPNTIVASDDLSLRLLEGNYNIWVISVDGEQAWQLTASEQPRGIPVWSPDSRSVLFVEGENDLMVSIEIGSGMRRELGNGTQPKYLPDKSGIGYIADGLMWKDAEGQEHTIVPGVALGAGRSVVDWDWMPDGDRVVFSVLDQNNGGPEPLSGTYSAFMIDFDGWEQLDQEDEATSTIPMLLLANDFRELSVSPDGRVIAGLYGSRFGDACFVASQLGFLVQTADQSAWELVDVADMQGFPVLSPDSQSFYSRAAVTWISDQLAFTEFHYACVDYVEAGGYLVAPQAAQMVQLTSVFDSNQK